MKFCFLCGLLTLLSVRTAAQENPVYKLFPSSVLFHVSFDNETGEAEFASGRSEPVGKTSGVAYKEGVFGGKALASGEFRYEALKNLDFTRPGSILCWISATDWPSEKPQDGKEPGFKVFHAYGKDYEFIMGKMGGQPKGVAHMNFYFQYPPPRKPSCCINFNTAAFRPDEWKMLVASWSPETLSNSVNSRTETGGKPLIKTPTASFVIGSSGEKNPKYPVLVDEVVILNRALSAEEVKTIYEESLKLLKKRDGAK
ncbi:MAG: hypothetical protein BWY31_02970 [Lentisphaerae bacterium ADurb.Bin242]|nr:MAG: hypothetical protein BWY31_02970 [Lentisphaerae bacterium ADurb.Bin242]